MAYSQAPIKMDIYMELPQGIQTEYGKSKDHILKLEKNIYGQKQAGCVWNSFLVDKLTAIGFTTSLIDDCISSRMTSYSWCTWVMVSSYAAITCNFKKSSKRSRI
jgi:hypothetical protein